MRVKDRVAIVTGGAMGIGKGIATVLTREGAKVAIVDIDQEEGERTVAALMRDGAQAIFLRADVADEEQVAAMVKATVEHFGSLAILVNNAAIGIYTPVHETTLEAWERCLRVNLTGPFLCAKYALPHLRNAGRGAIVNIASVHAYQNVGGTAPYAASKGGLVALTRVMAIDYAREGIRVNTVCPGWIYTPLIERIFRESGDFEGMKRAVTQRQLLGRLGTPEDIGYAVLYLVSDESAFVTGTSLFVDAGLTAQLETW
ncbi:MAG: glucose 1-dehydrogenase [Armatimonadota bacterium]|nr:glucose 1-dehydrogenase [Armatimonadota bacterium]